MITSILIISIRNFFLKITIMDGSFEDSNRYWREFQILIVGAKKTVKISEVRKLIQIQNDQQTNYFLRQDLEAVVICEQSNHLNSSSSLSSPGIFLEDFIFIRMGGNFEDFTNKKTRYFLKITLLSSPGIFFGGFH